MPDNQDRDERTGATPPAPTPPTAVGAPGNPLPLTDPRMMRALAHPARIAIWQFLGLEGPATATECADVAGLSPSACSYHLRTLARYGIVEEDLASAADRRERPWRVKIGSFNMDEGADWTPAMREAGRLLTTTLIASTEELRKSYRDRQSEYPADWRSALGANYDAVHVTPDELITLRQRQVDLLGEYRRIAPGERPPGARRVQVLIDTSPWFPPPTAAEGADGPE